MNDSGIAELLKTIADVIIAAANEGRPSGEVYAMLLPIGVTLATYEAIVATLVEIGKIKVDGHHRLTLA